MFKKVGNKLHRARVRTVVYQIHYLWVEVINETDARKDPWYKLDERQAYRDSLQAFVNMNLVKEFTTDKIVFSDEIGQIG